MQQDQEQVETLFWLRATIILCLFIAAVSVLDALIGLFSYFAFLAGKVDPEIYPNLHEAFEKIQKTPYSFLALNLYNIILWNGVIICSIWLFRYYTWSRVILKNLLVVDILVTIIHLLWKTLAGEKVISDPWLYIFLNALQIMAIIILSHPRMAFAVEQLAQQKRSKPTMSKQDNH